MPEKHLFEPDQLSLPSGCLVGGQLLDGDGDEFEIRRPSDGIRIRVERGAGPDLVDRAVTLARKAHTSREWADATPQQKAQIFRRWADLAQAHAMELLSLECAVSTRLASEALLRDIPVTIGIIRYYGELIDKLEGQVLASPADVFNLTLREPHGVVAGVSPWNVPLMLATVKLAPALAAGNAIVLKPSEFTPYSITRLAQLAIEAGIPAGQVGILPGLGSRTGHALITHPEVDYISFTGSTATGTQVMVNAALSGPKPVSLEMGGKSPQLVFADADLDAAALIVAESVIRNSGQICYAGTRLVIEESVVEPFLDKVAKAMAGRVPGPTWSKSATMSPIISQKQLDRISDILARGLSAGAETFIGGAALRTDGGGFFFSPTIIRGAKIDNPIIQEEVFGPVLAVQPFRDVEEALALGQHREFGLAAGLHTRDVGKIMRCARALQVGTVWVNQFGLADVVSPVGGYKRSGFGKDFGFDGLIKYTKTKNVSIKSL